MGEREGFGVRRRRQPTQRPGSTLLPLGLTLDRRWEMGWMLFAAEKLEGPRSPRDKGSQARTQSPAQVSRWNFGA